MTCDKISKGTVRAAVFLALAALAFTATPARAQTCTGPDGTAGDIIYNSTSDTFQGCTPDGWMAFNAAIPCPSPGDTCPDGTKYAGELGGVKLYTTPADAPNAYWGAHGFVTGEVSTTDGITNTNNIYAHVLAGDGAYNPPPDAAPNGSPNAALTCYNLVAHGHSDWYLPARDELEVMLDNSGVIGGFTSAVWYWSSTEYSNNQAYMYTTTGTSASGSKQNSLYLRCIRR